MSLLHIALGRFRRLGRNCREKSLHSSALNPCRIFAVGARYLAGVGVTQPQNIRSKYKLIANFKMICG
jgi:hypothetical protein